MFRLRISEGESGRDVLPRLSAFLELEHPAGGAGHGLRLLAAKLPIDVMLVRWCAGDE